MKQFLIKYRLERGTEEQRHQEIDAFISAINDDAALKGKLSYRCLKVRGEPDYYHLAEAADDATVQTLQSREFFSRYTDQTDVAADGKVEVLPLEVIAQTRG